MAEIEYGGIKIGGSKLLLLVPLLGTIGGALWGGFVFYKDYLDMKEQIQMYVAPDLSSMNERISVMEEQVVTAVDYTRDIKIDLKKDIQTIEVQVDRIESRVKETQDNIDDSLREVEIVSRESEKDVRDTMRETETRIEGEMDRLEKKLREQIEEALDNPLNAMI